MHTHSEFVSVVRGIDNSRSAVMHDPKAPIMAAKHLGQEIFIASILAFTLILSAVDACGLKIMPNNNIYLGRFQNPGMEKGNTFQMLV
ncbi:MAG: hypothetical protein AAF821_15195 [Cyanobacteria bacterium P01_D01_bin.156]